MEDLNFNITDLLFPPEKLAKKSKLCEDEVQALVNRTEFFSTFLSQIQQDVKHYQHDASTLNTKATLKLMYENIILFSNGYKTVKDICLEQFTNNITLINDLNSTYQVEVDVHTNLDYTFDFDKESSTVQADFDTIKNLSTKYLTEGSIIKQSLQDQLHEDLLNAMIAHQRAFITKVKFRLIERTNRRMDKARADITDWYQQLLRIATAIQDYMPYRFMETRARHMNIWSGPRAVVKGQNDTYRVQITHSHTPIITTWRRRDYFSNISQQMVATLISDFFEPIKTRIDQFDMELSVMEQDLTTALKGLRNLMIDYQRRDKLDENFVM